MRNMRLSNLTNASRSIEAMRHLFAEHAVREPQLPLPPPFDPMTLPLMQQAALMQMHESHFARTVYRRMLVDAQDKPQLPDYKALVNLCFARKTATDKWHRLTAQGVQIARELEQRLCKELDIHAMMGPIGSGPTVSFSCPCGWRTAVRNSNTAPGNARVSWNRHHATAAGIGKLVAALKPPAVMEG